MRSIKFGDMAKAKRVIRGYAFKNRGDGKDFEAKVVDELLSLIQDTELKVLINNARELFILDSEIAKQAFWTEKQYKTEKKQ